MKHISRSIRIIYTVVSLSASALSGQDEVGKVLQVHGKVKADDHNLVNNDVIRRGQSIQTFSVSGIRINFNGDGQLLLYPGTHIVVQKPGDLEDLHSDCSKRTVSARIKLLAGEIRLDHDPNKKDHHPRIVEVETPDGFICLFGTSIQVRVDQGSGTGVHVWETGAFVRHLDAKDWVKLLANNETFVRPGQKLRVMRAKGGLTPAKPDGLLIDSPLLDLFIP